jgi:hypothetical protein
MDKPKKRKKMKITRRNYWKAEEEELLKQWGDKAQCYQWMHTRSRKIYQCKNAGFTIPVIIISTITGTANFAQDRVSEQYREYVVMSIGALSILAGIITTIQQFLKISEINEGHRVSALSWGKFHRSIESELRRHPLDRMPATELIKISKDEYNRLIEISPQIPDNVVKEFNKKFKKKTELTKPEITNIINKTDVFDISDGDRKIMVDELNTNIIGSNNSMVKKYVDETNRLEKFRKVFYTLNHRDPTNEEIKQNQKYIKEDAESSDNDGYETDNTDDLENGKTDSGLSNFTDDNLLGEDGENEEQNEIVDLGTMNDETFL